MYVYTHTHTHTHTPVSNMTSRGWGGEPIASCTLYVTICCDLMATLSTNVEPVSSLVAVSCFRT